MIGFFLIAFGLGSCYGQKNLRPRQQQEKAEKTPSVTISINPTQPVQVTDYRITDNAPGAEVTRTQEHKAEMPTTTLEPTLTLAVTPDPNIPPACSDVGQEWISPRDEMTLVCVPAGEFSMGAENEGEDEKPVHLVTLDAYWIDKTEVTNAMFARFIEQTGYRTQAEKEGIGMVFSSKKTSWLPVFAPTLR